MSFWTKQGEKTVGIKSPAAILDFPIDFSAWLAVEGYASHTVTIINGTIAIDSSSHSNGTITVIVSGGVIGELAGFMITVTTVTNYVDRRAFYLDIKDR